MWRHFYRKTFALLFLCLPVLLLLQQRHHDADENGDDDDDDDDDEDGDEDGDDHKESLAPKSSAPKLSPESHTLCPTPKPL